MTHDATIGRLQWRCRRGTRELDQILGGFLERGYPCASEEMQHAFAQLLEQQDPNIYDWLMCVSVPADLALAQIVKMIRQEMCLTG